jgi:hypothetical protein
MARAGLVPASAGAQDADRRCAYIIPPVNDWPNVEGLFEAESRGPIHLRGYGPMETYTIVGRRSADSRESPEPSGLRISTPASSVARTQPAAISPLAISGAV